MNRSRKFDVLALTDRLFMRLSDSTRKDGLWVGALGKKADLGVLIEALDLIRIYDPVRYRRVSCDLSRVWSTIVPGDRVGEYCQASGACKIDSGYAARTSAAAVALVIVHEAAHARLRRFGYPENLRQRLEGICIRRERAFASVLPDDGELVRWVEERLRDPVAYSSAQLNKLRRVHELEVAKEIGLPLWIVNAVHAFRSQKKKG